VRLAPIQEVAAVVEAVEEEEELVLIHLSTSIILQYVFVLLFMNRP
jgi:hypothetical protein